MKKNIKWIIALIIVAISFTGAGVFAKAKYFSKDISYKKQDGNEIDLENALNELYSNKSNNAVSGQFQASNVDLKNIDLGFKPNHVIIYLLNNSSKNLYIWDYDNGKYYYSQSEKLHVESHWSINITDTGFNFKGYDKWYNGTAYYLATK